MSSERPIKAAPTALYAWLTVERALYAILVLLAAGIRLGWLSEQPLNPTEAGHAWSAWLVVNGHPRELAPAPDSPLLYALYTLLFYILGATDAIARVLPAFCGIGLVVLLWYWRPWLGRVTTLLAALLMAIDPWLIAYSRLADSAMLSILLGMLTLTGLLQMAAAEELAVDAPLSDAPLSNAPLSNALWRTITAISFGLLLVSGPQSWSFLVVLVLFVWFCLPSAHVQAWLREPGLWIVVAGAALVGATGWLLYPAGLGAVSTSLTVWFSQLTGAGAADHYTLGWVAWRLLLEQPLLLCFGLVGLGTYWWNRENTPIDAPQRWFVFLTAWLGWGLLLLLLPGRTPLVLSPFTLPLLLWAAHGLTLLWQQARLGGTWRENGLLMLILTILLISFAFWLAALTNNATFDGVLARTLLIILVLIFLIILAYTLWLDGRQARLATGILLAMLLLAATISSGWQLNQRFDLAFPDGFFATNTNPDVRRLAAAVQMLSAQRRGDAGELPIQVEMVGTPDPVLGWYLRDMRNLSWVLAAGMVDGQSPPVVITLSADSTVNGLASSYMGSQYALYDHWLPTSLTATAVPSTPSTAELGFGARMQERLNTLWSARWRFLLRWLIYREAPAIPPSDAVVLWVMADGNP